MAKKITARQKQLLIIIRDFTKSNGYPPSRRDLLDALGVTSTNTVACLLQALVDRELIKLLPKTARGIILTAASLEVVGPA
jgi:repressor LexA